MGCNQSIPIGLSQTNKKVLPLDPGKDEYMTAAMRSKRQRNNVYSESGECLDVSETSYPKNEVTWSMLSMALRKNMFFSHLTDTAEAELIDSMEPMMVTPGQDLIKQGDDGDYFYVVEEGVFEVFVDGESVATIGPQGSFGELSLLYNAPRAATVCSLTEAGKVWRVGRSRFRHIVAKVAREDREKREQALKNVPVLEKLTDEQIAKVACAVEVVQFNAGDIIIQKGEEGNVMYIITAGTVRCTAITNAGASVPDVCLGANSHFGERALFKTEPRAATVIATSKVEAYVLDRETFQEIIGSLERALNKNNILRSLRKVKLLNILSNEEKDRLADAVQIIEYKKGDLIVKQGEKGDAFYIVRHGKVLVQISHGKTSSLKPIQELGPGEFFGEMSILKDDVRKADVVAVSDNVECFELKRQTFHDLLGPLQNIIEREAKEREKESEAYQPVIFTANDLEEVATLGQGTFGTVKLVRSVKTGQLYALKIMHKTRIVQSKQQKNVFREKSCLLKCHHPFITQLHGTATDCNFLYMLMEYIPGGELFTLLHSGHRAAEYLSNDHAVFYAAQVLLALRHMHSKGIIYRDLKPENLVIDALGYIKIVDMGFAKVIEGRTYTLCGTPEYLAPEIILGTGHDKAVDTWALGILIFELVLGTTPFANVDELDDQITICRRIVHDNFDFGEEINISHSCKDIIKRLLIKDPEKRLGAFDHTTEKIMRHPWFKGVDWSSLKKKAITAPWVPTIRSPLDTSNFEPGEERHNFPDHVIEESDPFQGF